MNAATVTYADVLAARDQLGSLVRPTPMLHSRVLSERLGTTVLLKCENLNRAGSFKIRGAFTRISRLSQEEKSRGVVAASAGNHAQGVALASQKLGIAAKVYMPVGASMPKLNATRGYGATVEQFGAYGVQHAALPLGEFQPRTTLTGAHTLPAATLTVAISHVPLPCGRRSR